MLGFIGGTGPAGKGLALRLAMAGESVFIGSRSETNGAEAAELVNPCQNQYHLMGMLRAVQTIVALKHAT